MHNFTVVPVVALVESSRVVMLYWHFTHFFSTVDMTTGSSFLEAEGLVTIIVGGGTSLCLRVMISRQTVVRQPRQNVVMPRN